MNTFTQPISAKKGEVMYRKKLSKQHFGTKTEYPEEYNQEEMRKTLEQKIKRAQSDFLDLQKKGINFSPFLEIGSGHGQTSLVLNNDFRSFGYASDLAIEPLISINKIKKSQGFRKSPEIIFCDAETLPFLNNSFQFIFCYQTLHHFPHPLTVTKEIFRVLHPGGWFFFAEEPVKQVFNIRLWYRPTKLRWWEKILKVILILPFISKIGKTEIDHGIIENAFSLSQWKQSLDLFNYVETKLFPFPFGIKGSMIKIKGKWIDSGFFNLLNRLCLFFLGGGIKGLAQKKPSVKKINSSKKLPSVACVNCTVKDNHDSFNRQKLIYKKNKYICPQCRTNYFSKSGKLILLPGKLHKELYPN